MGHDSETFFDPTDSTDTHEMIGAELEVTMLSDIGCEMTAAELTSELPLDVDEDLTGGHIDACEPCQDLVSGVEGLN